MILLGMHSIDHDLALTKKSLGVITGILTAQNPIKLQTLKNAKNQIKSEVELQLSKGLSGLKISKFVGDAHQLILETLIKHFYPKDISIKYGLSFVLHGGSGHGIGFTNSDIDLNIVINPNGKTPDLPGEQQLIPSLIKDPVTVIYNDGDDPAPDFLSLRNTQFCDALRQIGFSHHTDPPRKLIDEFTGEGSRVLADKDALTYFVARPIAERTSDPDSVNAFKKLYGHTQGSVFTAKNFLERAVQPRPTLTENGGLDSIGMSQMDVKHSPGFWRTAQFAMTTMVILSSDEITDAQRKFMDLDPSAIKAALGTSEQFMVAYDFYATVRHAMSLTGTDWQSTKLMTDRLTDVAAKIGKRRIETLEHTFNLPRLSILNDGQRILRILDECSRTMISTLAVVKNQAEQKLSGEAVSAKPDLNRTLMLDPVITVSDREVLRQNALSVIEKMQASGVQDPRGKETVPVKHSYGARMRSLPEGAAELKAENDLKLIKLLSQAGRVGVALRFMQEYGILEVELPPLYEVRGVVEVKSRHFFTLQEHTIRTVEELDAIFNHTNPVTSALLERYAELTIEPELGSKEISSLYLASIFHDLGKSRVGSGLSHVQRGLELIDNFIQRYGDNSEQLKEACLLVKYHHLLRKDNVGAIKRLMPDLAEDKVDNPRFLYKLLLLSLADLKATQKETNLSEIRGIFEQYNICRQATGANSELEASFRNLREIVRLLPPALTSDTAMPEIIRALPTEYVLNNLWEDTAAVVVELHKVWKDIIAGQQVIPQVTLATSSVSDGLDETQTVVSLSFTAKDRPGLLRDVLSRLKHLNISSVNGLTVNGVAVDRITFTSTSEIDDHEINRYRTSILRALNGEQDTGNGLNLAKNGFDFQMDRLANGKASIKVSVRNVNSTGEVAYKVMAALTSSALNIETASIVPENERGATRVQATVSLPEEFRDDLLLSSIINTMGVPSSLVYNT